MTGIYIHIPFCKQKCHYCNFYSLASKKYREPFLEALILEIKLRKGYLGGEPIQSVYLGGGTPSLLKNGEMERIFVALQSEFFITRDAEITLEANPDDLDENFIRQLKGTPVNRLSIGVQSFHDKDLDYLNRVHSGNQAEKAIRTALDNGYDNLSIDLIFGIPTLSDADLISNIEKFLSYDLPHLSAYALTVEPKTALEILIRKGRMKNVDEDTISRQFMLLSSRMKEHGYLHYEISNFARGDNLARHNTNYWSGGKYLGLGPSAHSFDGSSRQWNVANLERYTEGLAKGVPAVERENLTAVQMYNEYVMVSLRTIWGVDQVALLDRFGRDFHNYFETGIRKFIELGLVEHRSSNYILTERGRLYADGIAAELFWPEDVA